MRLKLYYLRCVYIGSRVPSRSRWGGGKCLRSQPELVGTAIFSPNTHGPCESEVKLGASKGSKRGINRTPLLREYERTLYRRHQEAERYEGDTCRLSAAEVDQRYSKLANFSTRKLLLNGEGRASSVISRCYTLRFSVKYSTDTGWTCVVGLGLRVVVGILPR